MDLVGYRFRVAMVRAAQKPVPKKPAAKDKPLPTRSMRAAKRILPTKAAAQSKSKAAERLFVDAHHQQHALGILTQLIRKHAELSARLRNFGRKRHLRITSEDHIDETPTRDLSPNERLARFGDNRHLLVGDANFKSPEDELHQIEDEERPYHAAPDVGMFGDETDSNIERAIREADEDDCYPPDEECDPMMLDDDEEDECYY